MFVNCSELSNETETFCPPGLVTVSPSAEIVGAVVSTVVWSD